MTQENEVLTREGSRISFIATRPTTMQEDYVTITEREIPVNTIEQTWMSEGGAKTRVTRTTPKLVDTLVRTTKWLNHLGSGKIDDGLLEARHNIHHNFRINGIGR